MEWTIIDELRVLLVLFGLLNREVLCVAFVLHLLLGLPPSLKETANYRLDAYNSPHILH